MNSRPIEVGSPYYELTKPIPRTAKLRLALEILCTYPRVRWLMWRHDVPTVVRTLRGEGQLATDLRRQVTGKRLGQAAARTLAIMPFDSRCLVRSLVLVRMLAKRGIESTLVIGVDVEPIFSAHAWVESGGRALLEPMDGGSRLLEV